MAEADGGIPKNDPHGGEDIIDGQLIQTPAPPFSEGVFPCMDCHDGATRKGGFDMEGMLGEGDFDGALMFENLLTGKMPPADKEQPDAEEKQKVLEWLAEKQKSKAPKSYRRISRHEFVHSLNDLLGTKRTLSFTMASSSDSSAMSANLS